MVEYQHDLHGFFRDFSSDEDVNRLLEVMDPVELKAGGVLFSQDHEADGIYFIVSGKLAVQKETGFAARQQVVALLEKGSPVGEGGMLDGVLHSTMVVAVTDSTLLYLTRSSFDQLCGERPEFGLMFFRWLLGRVALRLQANTKRLAHVL